MVYELSCRGARQEFEVNWGGRLLRTVCGAFQTGAAAAGPAAVREGDQTPGVANLERSVEVDEEP
jgi:hypothetical protein